MHIQEGTNTTLTTCTKMTEEVDRRHGVNGNSSSKGVNDDPPGQSSAPAATGGRLKFFKDGKFILELVRGCAREGERAGWVSVPRKTFWPPAAAPPTPPHAAPPASLSLSDDNSSLHSSPCTSHRDHCWKQPAPRRHAARHLQLYYCRPATLLAAHIRRAAARKRRRPLDDCVPDPADDKYYHMKLKKPYHYHKLRVYKKTRPAVQRKELSRVVDRLREKVAALPVLVNAKLASCRQEHMMVSPRKRILREMERVSLEDQATKRRAKTVPALSTASYPPSPGPSHAAPGAGPRKEPGAKHVGSYSIQSLLSMPDEGARRSPASESPQPSPEGARWAGPGAFRAYAAPASYARWAPPAAQLVLGYGYAPAAFRAPPPPLWMHYAPAPWPPLAHPLLADHLPKDEPASDLPLNLSKH